MKRNILGEAGRNPLFRLGLVALWLGCAGAAWAQGTGVPAEGAPAVAPEPPAPPAEPAPKAKPSSTPVTVRASSEGFSLTSEDKAFQLKLRGYIQADGRFFVSNPPQPGSNTFIVRRARPLVEGTLFSAFDFRLLLDFGGGTATVQDAYLDIKPASWLRLRAGKFKAPFGLERLQSATSSLFVERALPTNLVPNRDIGVQLHGDVLGGRLTYAAGLFNGVPDGSSADANSDNSFDLVGRLYAYPLKGTQVQPLEKLGLGFAASRGRRSGTAAAPNLAPFRSTAQQIFFSYSATTATAEGTSADGPHLRLSPQATWFWGPFGLVGEYVSSSEEVKRGPERAQLWHQAWQASIAWVLFGGDASFEGVRPTRALNVFEGAWGAVELDARYSHLSVDPGTFPTYADPARSAREARSWGIAANWYLSANVRVVVHFDSTTFVGGATDGDRPTETLFLSRFQVSW